MNRKFPVVLLLLLFILMICIINLGMFTIKIYQKYNYLRIDPLGIINERDAQEGEYDYLLIGDSLMANWEINDYSVANKGISAQTSGQVKYRMMLLGNGIHAKKTIICVGGNDLKILRFDSDLSTNTVNTSISNIREIIKISKDISEKTYVLTVPPIYSVPFYMKPFNSTHIMFSSLEKLNHGIIDVAHDENVKVVDVENVLSEMNAEDILAPDNIHLSEKAYEKIFTEIKSD